MSTSDTFSIRPAGRHILTIGRDLIQDQHAAVVELVKNAFDADSSSVHVSFDVETIKDNNEEDENKRLTIIIEDFGHGMSRETVIHKWLVPSTDDKIQRRTSPGGRLMQGRKGVGRYAASILGDSLLLETRTISGESTTVYLEWEDFNNKEYLDEVEVLVESRTSTGPSGTKLTIIGSKSHINEWNKKEINKLRFELRKLIHPIKFISVIPDDNHGFDIFVSFGNLTGDGNYDHFKPIEPYPIFDFFDYRIFGVINEDGNGELVFVNQRARNTLTEKIPFILGENTGCGGLAVDIRVYDRDRDSVDLLIRRGLKDDDGNYVGKNQARQLLNEYNGIGVYRNGFRIRPLGDPDFDWLTLNERRIQKPTMRISSNQAIGYVQIQSEELSGLEEKSARDGLRENYAYNRLRGSI